MPTGELTARRFYLLDHSGKLDDGYMSKRLLAALVTSVAVVGSYFWLGIERED